MTQSGQMDIRPQQEMWTNFIRLITWSVLPVVATLLLMAFFLV